ncbi:MAG TPA: hypothetical protein VGU61_07890 [Noviherbaspirillum sp.]|jgi:hypothetical protein|uniref:hypothetical protein n=1 Tax=Noviherbaspirillum sp. TaxID=1926288 RepID=UPI002DDDBCFA|nr:hypothetical protein [Noviherbaspirillum sp.]HEV2610173.1 hypothetical protein [Noviherbaspirillum sp.]
MNMVSTRTLSEHLCTLATVLESEALRAQALKLRPSQNLFAEASQLRILADQLWQKNSVIELPSISGAPGPLSFASPRSTEKRQARHAAPNTLVVPARGIQSDSFK